MTGSLSSQAATLKAQLAPDLVTTSYTKYRYVEAGQEGTTGPVGFAREVLGIPAEGFDEFTPGRPYLWQHQQDIALSVAEYERSAVASCHAIGKDFSAGRLIVPWFLNSFTPSIVITTGPTDRQVKLLLWGEIKTAKLRAIQELPGRDNMTEWRIAPDHYAIGFKSKDQDPERFAGFHAPHILYVVDEASGVDDTIFQAIEGGLSSGDARILMIGNPLRVGGQFHRAFHQERKLWHTIQIAAADTPNFRHKTADPIADYLIKPKWAEEKRLQWGEDSPLYQARVLGQFPTEGVNTLISLVWVMNAMQAVTDPAASPKALATEMGVDVARYGNNETSFLIRQGTRFVHQKSWGSRDLMTSAKWVSDAIREFSVKRCRVDVIGLGAGLYDRLVEYQEAGSIGPEVELIPVNVATPPTDQREGKPSLTFRQLRDEMWWNLREKFRTDQITDLPEDADVLVGQLTSITYDYKTGKLIVEKKEDMTERLGGDEGSSSPDRAEAMMLAYWDSEGTINDEGSVKEALDDGMDTDAELYAGLADKTF